MFLSYVGYVCVCEATCVVFTLRVCVFVHVPVHVTCLCSVHVCRLCVLCLYVFTRACDVSVCYVHMSFACVRVLGALTCCACVFVACACACYMCVTALSLPAGLSVPASL